jgi:hypothetical protein
MKSKTTTEFIRESRKTVTKGSVTGIIGLTGAALTYITSGIAEEVTATTLASLGTGALIATATGIGVGLLVGTVVTRGIYDLFQPHPIQAIKQDVNKYIVKPIKKVYTTVKKTITKVTKTITKTISKVTKSVKKVFKKIFK